MKKITLNYLFVIITTLLSFEGYSQLHAPPSCGENFTLDWSASPSASNEYNWLPGGALSNTFSNVDASGIDITVTFTGDTSSLGSWGGQTPKVGNSSSFLYEGLDLYTSGFSSSGITCTITFSSPIYALSFDMHHVNSSGANGDKYTITGIDTDGNTVFPTFTNSASPSYTTDDATGIINAVSSSTSGDDAIVGVNFADANYITSVTFLWQDCNTCSPFNVHGSGLGNFSFCLPQTLDFDGVNDYIARAPFLGGVSEVTMMTWLKRDTGATGGEIMGQRNFRIYIDGSNNVRAYLYSNNSIGVTTPSNSNTLIQDDLWYHVASIFDNTTGDLSLYLNGNLVANTTNPSLVSSTINNTSSWNDDHDFEIGRNTESDNNYFEGSIYETRVYGKALDLNQLHRQINQEIVNNSGNVQGSVIPKDIEGLLWSDLLLYYKMDIIDTGYTPDYSNSAVDGGLNNMRTYQDRTAPLPYTTTNSCSGSWNNVSNWEYGSVWDITGTHPDCAIVHIKGNMTVDSDHSMVGLLIDSGSELQVTNNSGLFNSWYLKLDGKIDLNGESQLIQQSESTLDANSSGTLEKDQQGTADTFTYNFWSSPVGLSNGSTNNNAYTAADIFTNVTFSNSTYNGIASPLTIADYWIWKYANKQSNTYSQWEHARSTGIIQVGEGFTMKGPGSGSITDEQNYILEGKPNNGDIDLTINAGNDYLIGNPYPSAMDAHEFIIDNGNTINGTGSTTGTLYFWEHWGGGSHILREYQGGYATYTLSGGVPAAAKGTNNPDVGTGGTPLKTPGRYIPVGQGFFVQAESTGTIKFRNSQRMFQTEDGSNSIFLKAASKTKSNNSEKNQAPTDSRLKLRLGFYSVNTIRRQLLTTVDQNSTMGIDWGYDALYIDTQSDDMYWMITNEKHTVQGINELNANTILPLGIHTKNDGTNSITIDKLENAPSNLEVYLHDKEMGTYHDLKSGDAQVFLMAGEYLNRFEITFSNGQTLSNNDNDDNRFIEVYYSNEKNSIVIDNPNVKEIKSVEMLNMLGQSLFKFNLNTTDKYIEYKADQFTTGHYILNIETAFSKISKKVLVKK
ncbi:LamG-like jellyroll fold domain-containing protein [Seonamhaeicola marinus]|uniref:T9SS type A sorting domain-containing protein n=1 Tax=Seonamhaeicola marinus TaxID=1912246 RepID=A0A5D0JGP8_9FLAO|nr:LamG-like jellyroll fold domain-containing protein [Seonamhaeicola marinus]TYA94739.1 hypothetical protein FUA24_00690 [Seonamhaeicola marinus]